MPKYIDKQEVEKIVGFLARTPAGQGIADIELACKIAGLEFDRRTLQRRLGELVRSGNVFAQGEARARRYLIRSSLVAPVAGEVRASTPAPYLVARGEAYVPLSPEGAEVKDLVSRSILERKPVGYQRAFLEAYDPNRSAYLPDSVRNHLHVLGRSPGGERAAGTYARDVLNRLMIDLSWASSRLEGNTYSLLDTQNLIEFGHAAEGKDQRDAQMILNHKAAIEMLVDQADETGFDTFTFFNLHALLSDGLLANAGASGRLRSVTVEIAGSVFLPLAFSAQIGDYFRLLLEKAAAINDPFEQAFFTMVHIPYLQPFLDVNKRVSRLGANIPLIKHNLSPLSFVDVPERAYVEGILGVYELNRVDLLRDVFVWAYERSCRRYVAIKESLPEPDPLRLRNREALTEVVSEIVRAGKPITMPTIRELAAPLVSADDQGEFVAMVFNELHHLHEGSVARYRLRLSEYQAWKKAAAGMK